MMLKREAKLLRTLPPELQRKGRKPRVSITNRHSTEAWRPRDRLLLDSESF